MNKQKAYELDELGFFSEKPMWLLDQSHMSRINNSDQIEFSPIKSKTMNEKSEVKVKNPRITSSIVEALDSLNVRTRDIEASLSEYNDQLLGARETALDDADKQSEPRSWSEHVSRLFIELSERVINIENEVARITTEF